ncbi:hypothetical protein [Nocardia terpenica]|uniref:hypothetical protein n=1 Tax=Nocardia terpenica TaxID=455432 RepID=UPI0023B179E2|nr:hypothetical protein [Nocardia terpenica]
MLVIDELHNVLGGRVDSQREFLSLRFWASHLVFRYSRPGRSSTVLTAHSQVTKCCSSSGSTGPQLNTRCAY